MEVIQLKLHYIIIAFILALTFQSACHSQEIDKELANVSTNLARLIRENGKKKVTVLDFTDLQGGESELGKYIAEELTIDLVMVKKDFAVLDRANLRKILAEHKLTAQGLVDPDNAKKLGQFAGVDAIILGTLIPKGQKIALAAKIITTDTAEIVAGAKAEFQSDENVQKLASRSALTDSGPSSTHTRALASQDFSSLRVNVDKLTITDEGEVIISFSFQNKSTQNPIAVAFYHDPCFTPPCYLRTRLIAANGKKFETDDDGLKGVGSLRNGPDALTEIEPGGTIKASLSFTRSRLERKATSFNLEAEIVVNQNYKKSAYENFQVGNDDDALPPGCKLHNLVLDIPSP